MSEVTIIVENSVSDITVSGSSVFVEVANDLNNIEVNPVTNNVTTTSNNVNVQIVQTVSGGGSTDTAYLDIELLLKSGTSNRYKVFTYTGDNVTNQKVYEDNTLASLLYDIDYTYSGDNLSSIVVERLSDSFTYTKTFTYLSDNLISINYV